MVLSPSPSFRRMLCDCSRYWDYCRARGAAGVQNIRSRQPRTAAAQDLFKTSRKTNWANVKLTKKRDGAMLYIKCRTRQQPRRFRQKKIDRARRHALATIRKKSSSAANANLITMQKKAPPRKRGQV